MEIPILTRDSSVNTIFDNDQIITQFKSHHNHESEMGLMPLICKKLLEARAEAKKSMKIYVNDPIKLPYFTSKSNALKLLANSIYGETGYLYSPFYRKTIASSVTAFSRETIKKVITFLESKHCNIIYGDTDLVFFTIPETHFSKINSLYSHDKQLHYSESIKKSIEFTKQITPKVNSFIKTRNWSSLYDHGI